MFWANGGPSHLDTFDLKPDAPAEIRGPFRPIPTNVPGVCITERLPRLALRPIVLILAASIVFGYLLKPLGLVLSTILLIIVSAAGGHEFRLREVLVLAAGLTVFSIAVFVYALGLPFPLWPELWNE